MAANERASDGARLNGGVEVPFHWLAVAGTVALIGASVSVLYRVTDIVGGSEQLVALVAITLAAAWLLARRVPVRAALILVVGLLVAGLAGYYLALPSGYPALLSVRRIVTDNVALLSGLSVLRMTEVGAWALGVAPALVFAPWYLVLRRRYAAAVTTGGLALGFFVLTGDANTLVTLAGVVGAMATLGFGTLARRGGTVEQADALAVVLVAVIVVSTTVSVVPGGASSPIIPGGEASPTVEGSIVSSNERVPILGSIRLSPKVRFTVTANEPAYWRIGAYGRYTGDSWFRTVGSDGSADLSPPPGETATIRQTVEVAANGFNAMPAAWRPVRVTGLPRESVQVTGAGGLKPSGSLSAGSSYTVVSQVPRWSERELRTAETDYPDSVERRYLQLPDSTSDRLSEYATRITADADNPYDTAVAIERWLERNKEYSRDVDRPDGDIADSFVFEMQRGYCTYYATAMVTMLRTQGVPARYVVGYTSGQRVGEDEWVVRGLDSHAWVEVYFPDVRGVRFDPTPGEPRRQAERSRIEQARAANVSNVDAAGSDDGEWEPTTTEPDPRQTTDASTSAAGSVGAGNATTLAPKGPDVTVPDPAAAPPGGSDGPGGGGVPFGVPSTRQTAFGLIVLVGALAGAHRTGLLTGAYRALWLRWQPRREPRRDVERAFARLEYLLGREHRERRSDETIREYLSALDDGVDRRARRVATLYERARYAGTVSPDEADEAVTLVGQLVRDRA